MQPRLTATKECEVQAARLEGNGDPYFLVAWLELPMEFGSRGRDCQMI